MFTVSAVIDVYVQVTNVKNTQLTSWKITNPTESEVVCRAGRLDRH